MITCGWVEKAERLNAECVAAPAKRLRAGGQLRQLWRGAPSWRAGARCACGRATPPRRPWAAWARLRRRCSKVALRASSTCTQGPCACNAWQKDAPSSCGRRPIMLAPLKKLLVVVRARSRGWPGGRSAAAAAAPSLRSERHSAIAELLLSLLVGMLGVSEMMGVRRHAASPVREAARLHLRLDVGGGLGELVLNLCGLCPHLLLQRQERWSTEHASGRLVAPLRRADTGEEAHLKELQLGRHALASRDGRAQQTCGSTTLPSTTCGCELCTGAAAAGNLRHHAPPYLSSSRARSLRHGASATAAQSTLCAGVAKWAACCGALLLHPVPILSALPMPRSYSLLLGLPPAAHWSTPSCARGGTTRTEHGRGRGMCFEPAS